MSRNQETTTPTRSADVNDDRQLARAAKQSPDAFGTLYERYLNGIYNYCLRRVDSLQAAEDLTATVFERAFSRIDTYRDGSFRTWLFRIAHNAVTDHYRRRKNVISWQPHMSGADDEPSPEEQAIATEARADLHKLLTGLTEDQRRVVELRLSGLTGSEIAGVLDRSPDAVKMLQYRALERMRTQLSINSANSANAEIRDE